MATDDCADALRELRDIADRLTTGTGRGLEHEQADVVALIQRSRCGALAALAHHARHDRPEHVLLAWRQLVVKGLEPEEPTLPTVKAIRAQGSEPVPVIATAECTAAVSPTTNPWLDHARRVVRVLIARVERAADATEPGGDAKAPAPPGGADEAPVPALTASQSLVLRTMARFDGSRLLSAKMIADEMDATVRLSEETVRQCVGKLIAASLAERPEGERSGARLNSAGRKLAGKIAD